MPQRTNDVDFRPEKPRLDPLPPPPKPSVRMNGALTIPGGRPLLSAPTINLNELWDPLEYPAENEPKTPSPKTLPFPGSNETKPPFKQTVDMSLHKNAYSERPFFPKNEHSDSTDESGSSRLPPLPEWKGFRPKKVEEIPERSLRLPDLPPPACEDRPVRREFRESPPARQAPRSDAFETPLVLPNFRSKTTESPGIETREPVSDRKQPIVTFAEPEVESAASFEPVVERHQQVEPEFDPRPPKPSASMSFRPEPSEPLLATRDLKKSYYKGKLKIPVLKGVDFSVCGGEFVSIVGQSGSGKSTLLHLLGTLDNPESGSIHFDGRRIDNLSISRRDVLRNREIGFIFQFYHLLPELTTLENVLSPLMIRESVLGYMVRRKRHIEKARSLLEEVGLSHRLKHRPRELSGGEMQRAAIARALVTEPKILFADEPTGNLDATSAREIIDILRRLNQDHRLTIVMVTHDHIIAQAADRIVRMVDGVIVENDRLWAENPFFRQAQ